MADIEGIRAFLDADETGWNRGFSNAAKTVDDFVSKTGKKLEKVGSELTSIGTKLTASITVPVGAAFAFAVKAASDAVETTSKFQFIFRETSREANAAATELRNNYGLALTTSQDLLASTGDILQGFGLTAKESLATSLEVQKLAADIASLKNVQGGAAQASYAITSALLGERESLKGLGIALLDAEVKYRAKIVAAREGIKADSRQAQTIASMELITERAANAVGDLARTWDSAANQSRILGERVKELRENIGQKLMPVYTRLLQAGNDLIAQWNALNPKTQQQIIYYTGLAAVIGPAFLAVGLFVGGIGKLISMSVPLFSFFGSIISFFGSIVGGAIGLVSSFASLIPPILGFFGTILSGALGLVGPLLGIAAVAGIIYAAFGDLIPGIDEIFSWIKDIFKETADFWSGVVNNILGNAEVLTEGQRIAVEFIMKPWRWLKKIYQETADFWGGVVKNILGNTDTLTTGQRTAVEYIAKIWLGLKIAWNAVIVGVQTLAQGIVDKYKWLLEKIAFLADKVHLNSVAEGARAAAAGLGTLSSNLGNAREESNKTIKEMMDSWGKAPDILKNDVKIFSDTVKDIKDKGAEALEAIKAGSGVAMAALKEKVQELQTKMSDLGQRAIEGLKDKTPEAVKTILDLIADINARLKEGPKIEIPVGVTQESSGLAFIRQWEEEQAAKRVQPADFGMQESSGIAFLRGWDAEKTRSALDDIADVWDEWIDNNIESLKNWKETAAGYVSGFVSSISDALAEAIVYNKNFASAMVSIAKQMSVKLISEAIKTAIAIIAWDQAKAKANGGAEAPSVWLIPAYMAAAAAFFAIGMAGTIAGSSGTGDMSGGGTATVSQPAQEPTPVTTIVREPAQNEQENRMMRMVVQTDFGEELMAFNVRESKKGRGDGVDRLLTTRDQS